MTNSRLPFHKHLKWLILEGNSYENVCEFYENLQFPEPTESYFQNLKDDVDSLPIPPITRRRLGKKIYHENDVFVWKKLDLEEIYLHRLKGAKWSGVLKILNNPILRVAIDCCLIASVDLEELGQLVITAYNTEIDENSAKIYKKYFFDAELMKRNDWQSYLNLLASDRYTYTRVFAALTKSRDEVLHLVGMPTKAQFGTMLKNVMNTAHYRFEYFARQNGPDAQEQARKWAKILMDAGAKHEKFGATDATDFANLIQTEFHYIESDIQTVTPEMLADAKPKALEKEPERNVPIPPEGAASGRPANDI